MNFNGNEKNKNKIVNDTADTMSLVKTEKLQPSFQRNFLPAIIFGITPVILLITGTPLANGKKGGLIVGGGVADMWQRWTANMYSSDWIFAAILTLLCVIASGIILYIRRSYRPNLVDSIALGASFASSIPLIFAGIANFYDHTKTTTGGGIGVVSGSEVQGTFGYYAIIFTLIWYSIALLIHYKSRKNA